ncbi:cytochrome P450 [Phyllobacterium phragmitis]|nr:cytochrome P450 [Phyllobacterium phragmitis]
MPLAFGMRPLFLLTDPDYIKPLLKMPEEVMDKGPMVKKVRAVTGNNVTVLGGEENKRRRAVLHSVVGRTAVEGLTPMLARETRMAIAEVMKDGTFDARQFGASVALRLVSVVSFGANALSPEDVEIVIQALRQAMVELANTIFGPLQMPWAYLAQRRRIEGFKQDMIGVVRRVRQRAPESAIIRSYGELGLSDRDTADEILTLLLAGHDTTGATVAWLCHTMATMPELADQIAAEADAVRDDEGEIDFAKLASATTTTAAVREVLRLFPPGYWTGRGVREDVEFGGRKLRRGTAIIVSPWLFHRCSRFWEAPNEFRLDRNYTAKAYIPFGTGPRVCIGQALAFLELQIITLEVASAMRLVAKEPLGAPVPGVHLSPPAIPMEARERQSIRTSPSKNSGLASDEFTSSELAEPFRSGCPVHAHGGT